MATKAINKTNDTSKNETSKKSNKRVNNNYSRKERGKSLNTGFEMPNVDKKIAEHQMAKKFCVDETKEALIKRIKGFTIDNNEVIQDRLEIPLVDKYVPSFETDFNMFFATAKDYVPYAARDNPRNQMFSDTAKSCLRTAVYRPERYLPFTSSFNIAVADKYSVEKRGNKEYLILEGDVQVTDSATRSLLWEHMRQDGSFDECLEKVIIPFSVKLRSEYESDVEFAQACTAQNTSKPLTPYERAYGFGCFNSVPARFGKYADMVVLKKNQAKNGKVYLKDLLSYIGSQNCMLFANEITKNKEDMSHCASDVYTTSVLNTMIAEKEKLLKNFNPDNYFGYIDDKGETIFEMYSYLANDFLNDLLVMVKENSITPKQFEVYVSGRYDAKKTVYKWNAATLRVIYNCFRSLIKEDENGKEYYICNPVKLLKNKLFIITLTNSLYSKLTIGVEAFENGERIKRSTIESRIPLIASQVYTEINTFVNDVIIPSGLLNN